MVMKCSTAFVLLSVSLLSFSCQNEDLDLQNGIVNSKVFVDENLTSNSFNLNVSEEEAVRTASSFLSDNSQLTRSSVQNISNVEALTNQQGDTLIYAVNFADNQGYVLVAATKKYTPILGYAEKGHFDATVKGLDIWLEDEMNILTACLSDTTEMFNRQWGEYMIERSPTKVSTRVESAFPQNLDWWWMEFANELTYPDYSSNYEDQTAAPGELINSYCYHIDEARSFFPDFSYIFDEMAAKCASLGYDERDVIYHFRDFKDYQVHGPILKTNWHQGWPYNWKVDKPLGCVTVAVGQIMYHHKIPAYYDWESINVSNRETDAQGSFFKNLGESLGIDYSGDDSGASTGDAERVLKSFGYKVKQTDEYTVAQINMAFRFNNPILMGGHTHQILGFDAGNGHAWVCDGYKYENYTTIMTVYFPEVNRPTDGLYTENPYREQWSLRGEAKSGSSYLHMNWGWKKDADEDEDENGTWNLYGDYTAPNEKVYHRNTEFLFVEP